MGVVPEADRRLREVILVAERTQARRTEHETLAVDRFDFDPACGEYPQKMSTGKAKASAERQLGNCYASVIQHLAPPIRW
jgi:hypothetical protein